MKPIITTLYIIAFHTLNLFAQNTQTGRYPLMRPVEKDVIKAYYNENYYLIGDSCAEIVRQGHYDTTLRKFTGSFIDVSKLNPKQVVAKGIYDKIGSKEGDFITYYLNGKLQSRGNFKANTLNGVWDFYYPSGKPKLTVEVNGADIKIINGWNEGGRRTVKNESGKYELYIGAVVWRGKIRNGKPDGKWAATRIVFRQEEPVATEVFQNGVFQYGKNVRGVYKDRSNIHFLDGIYLPVLNAERLLISRIPCNAYYGKKITSAQYSQGPQEFITEVKYRLTPVLDKLQADLPIDLQIKILNTGKFVLIDTASNTDPKIISALKPYINHLPRFIPATIDGKDTEQDMILSIRHVNDLYRFTYRLIPIKAF